MMPAGSEAWDRAFNATDELLIEMQGPIQALGMIVESHPTLGGQEHGTAALRAVIGTLDEKAEALKEIWSEEYRAGNEAGQEGDLLP